MGFENLYRLRETELDLALLLCRAAVINFACECGERCLQSETRQAARSGKRRRLGLLLNSSMVALGLRWGWGWGGVISVVGNWRAVRRVTACNLFSTVALEARVRALFGIQRIGL